MSLSPPSIFALLCHLHGGALPKGRPKVAGSHASLGCSPYRGCQRRQMGHELAPREPSNIGCIGSWVFRMMTLACGHATFLSLSYESACNPKDSMSTKRQ